MSIITAFTKYNTIHDKFRQYAISRKSPGFTQSLTEMSTRSIQIMCLGRCVGLTTLPPSVSRLPNISQPYRHPWLVTGIKTKLRGLSPRANYIYRATVACRRRSCQLLQIEGVTRSAWRIPYCRILGFLDRSRYFFFKVAPQLYSRGRVDPVPDPLLLRKYGSAGNRTWSSGYVARNSDH
jgi:hypothetical protein